VISLDWTLILQFFNFLILLLILNKMLYRPLTKIMAERTDKIEGGREKATALEAEIEAKMQSYQEQLNAAKSGASLERAELRKAAHLKEAEITGEAQKKATARVKVIREQVEKEAELASQALKDGAESMAEQIASKVLGRKLA